MTFPDRYKNMAVSVTQLVDSPIKLQKFTPQFYFIYKDPVTGSRCSSPIQMPKPLSPPPTPNIKIGRLRNDQLYLIQTDEETHTLRSPSRAEAIRRLSLNGKKINRASIVCEGFN